MLHEEAAAGATDGEEVSSFPQAAEKWLLQAP
jgi:hypothetical protein